MKRWLHALMLAGAVCLAASNGHTAVAPGDVIIGIFEPGSVITQGFVQNSPALGEKTFFDNSSTAFYSIGNSTMTDLFGTPPLQGTASQLIWGANPSFSALLFFGAQIPADFDEPFLAGRMAFFNGTSALESLIFAVTISFYNNVVSPSTFLGSDQIVITTTNNVTSSLAGDADYVNICGHFSTVCDSSLQAFEIAQGGTGVTFDLYGRILGNPKLFLTDVTLTPGQDPLTSGLVGTQPPIGVLVPEPASAGILVAALGLFGLVRHRRRVRAG
ncbi:MAG: PEP-CTERM sorting domain-containing protein [Alphaproteobacteria bacterium]